MEPILLRADRAGERADQLLARLVPELLWVPLLIVPSLWALLTSLFTERVFEKYLPKEDELSLSGGEE